MRHPKTMRKDEREAAAKMVAAMRRIERDLHWSLLEQGGVIPDAWFDIETDLAGPSAERARITLRLDEDVVRFFKGLGPGYQARINGVLRAYVQGRLARIIEGPDATDWVLHPERMDPGALSDPPVGTRERRELQEARSQIAEARKMKDDAWAMLQKSQRVMGGE